jgi:CheY-like chemotaxis protein/HPt (histidine-containing phosphotransfer) domain-containing protein
MTPRILLVEDDPVSRRFLGSAAEALPAQVDAVDGCIAAIEAARHRPYALWLIDANLPDGSGIELLARLRTLSATTPALAHTASERAGDHDALRVAGFLDVLVKPIGVRDLQASLCRALGFDEAMHGGDPGCILLPDWDDNAALAALKGEQAHVAALRRLFLDELPQQRDAVDGALGEHDAPRAQRTLHMLRASCGFVGAARLAAAVRDLESDPRSALARERFRDAVDDLLAPVA